MSGGHLSKEFFELVKSIGETRSKQEEDKIIITEVALLKLHLSKPGISAKKMKEYMVRAVYVEMLGHDASFACIHAVKLAHEKNLLAKRIGYLTCNLFLHCDHELMLLMISTMQRDLQSANHLEVCAALTSVCRLVNLEMVPAMSPLLFKLLSHQQEAVRKKAIVTVNKFYRLTPETVLDQQAIIRKVLCDPDPAVMGASLHVLYEIAKNNPSTSKDLVPSFASILKQIIEHRLPRDFDYHRMPAPWLQVKLISILSLLGTADQKASEQMYEILQECMRRADTGVMVGSAIIYECVKCIARIYPDRALLEGAASNISRFISSDNRNLRYLGVTGLAQIVQVNASYATEHQMVVVDCLEDPDESLKRKTLDLLFRMTNPQNVVVVVDKMTFYLRTSVDSHLRQELVQRITSLAERFAPDNEWYVNTMNQVFELGGELVPAETAYNLMRLIAEGTGEDEEADNAFRTFAVNTYLKLLEKPSLSDIIVQVIAWVLGEYARVASVDGYSIDDIIDLLCDCVDRPFEDMATRGYLVSALMKLMAQHCLQSGAVNAVISSYRSSRFTDLQQRCYEFQQLQSSPALMQKVLPYDASCEEISMNNKLPFLDAFVQQKLHEGAKQYLDMSQRLAARSAMPDGAGLTEVESKPTLNFTPYSAPSKPQPGAFPAVPHSEPTGATDAPSSGYPGGSGIASATPTGLNVSGPRKWGPSGYNQPGEAPPPPPPDKPAPTSESPSYSQAAKPATISQVARAAQEAPAMTEKQKMAAALFGGVTGATMTNSATSKPASAVQAVPAAPAPEPAAPAAEQIIEPPTASPLEMMDLLDLDRSADVTPDGRLQQMSAPPPPPPTVGGSDLLLDMSDEGLTAPTTGPPSATVAPVMQMQLSPPAPQPLLGPLPVTTAQLGAMWGQLPTERRAQLQTSILNCQELMQRLTASLNVHPVEIIGMEGIAAGRVLPGNDPCFLHGKLAPPRLDVLVRCRDPAVGQRVAELCMQYLA